MFRKGASGAPRIRWGGGGWLGKHAGQCRGRVRGVRKLPEALAGPLGMHAVQGGLVACPWEQ